MMNPKDLINWRKLSELLTGSPINIRKDHVPKKYEAKVNRLIKIIAIFVRWVNAR